MVRQKSWLLLADFEEDMPPTLLSRSGFSSGLRHPSCIMPLSGRLVTSLFHMNIYHQLRARIQTNLLRIAALSCFCLFAVPFSSFAQCNSDPAAYSPGLTVILSENVAEGSLQHAIACATAAVFSPVSDMAGSAPRDLARSDQAQPPQEQTTPPAREPGAPSLPDLFPPSQTKPSA